MLTFNRLVTLGCSFTYGEELSNPKEQAWPSLLSKTFEIDLLNLAKPGYSNDHIMHNLLEINLCSDDLVVIGFAPFNRILFENEEGWFTTIPNFYKESKNELITQVFKNTSIDFLIKRFLVQIVYVQTLLDKKNTKWLFFNPSTNLRQSDNIQKYSYLTNQIDSNRFWGWPYYCWLDLIGDEKVMPKGHPTSVHHIHLSKIFADKIKLLYDI